MLFLMNRHLCYCYNAVQVLVFPSKRFCKKKKQYYRLLLLEYRFNFLECSNAFFFEEHNLTQKKVPLQ